MIEDCRRMPNQCTSSIRHTPREGNRAAYCLAKMGVEQETHLMTLMTPLSKFLDKLTRMLLK
ncbi:hypothetical protein RHMOL_Rhmol13G0250400 [Rhododendron molle]|uniref:Uncharacterized protein n=1 Tax=Rhododendron molle TaxID=49168 RepID=A0ACC0LBE8_RHOML|nr:hypothetical protein RHMOL_Rhmol13G0250400 [Rhododendron molle]